MLPIGFLFRRSHPPSGNRARNCEARRNINAARWSDSRIERDRATLFCPLEARSKPTCDEKIDPFIIKFARIAFARILDSTL